MILLIILGIAAALAVATGIIAFRTKSNHATIFWSLFTILTIAIGATCIGLHREAIDEAESFRTEWKEYMLCVGTIEECDNEYVRLRFYEDITDYNERVEKYRKYAEGPLVGALYPDEAIEGYGIIDFELVGDQHLG